MPTPTPVSLGYLVCRRLCSPQNIDLTSDLGIFGSPVSLTHHLHPRAFSSHPTLQMLILVLFCTVQLMQVLPRQGSLLNVLVDLISKPAGKETLVVISRFPGSW